jgi:hypothetical protein
LSTISVYQRVRMKRLDEAINDAGDYEVEDFCDVKSHLYFPWTYRDAPPERYRAETLEHVPFLAEFRCLDGVVEPRSPLVVMSPW